MEPTLKIEEMQKLEEHLELLKVLTNLQLDHSHPESHQIALQALINSRQASISQLESDWDRRIRSLQKTKMELQNSLYGAFGEKLVKLQDTEQTNELVLSEIKKREHEIPKLSFQLERLPALPSRATYIDQVKEITKSCHKQDLDIERIIRETRELQLERNAIQERLTRTHRVLDEIVHREAKNSDTGRRAYRLLTDIHRNFEQITEKILETDRVRREAADFQNKLSARSCSRNIVDIAKT